MPIYRTHQLPPFINIHIVIVISHLASCIDTTIPFNNDCIVNSPTGIHGRQYGAIGATGCVQGIKSFVRDSYIM